jgi:hypothetical protein
MAIQKAPRRRHLPRPFARQKTERLKTVPKY